MDRPRNRIRWIFRLILFLFLVIPFGIFSRPAFSQQICNPASPEDGACQLNGFPDCYHCTQVGTAPPQCTPNDAFCQGHSGGDNTDNICRIGICIPGFSPNNPPTNNPTGCNYVVDPTPAPECVQCNDSTAPFANHCPNGVCEPALGETPASCSEDCLVPAMTPAPLPTQGPMNLACAAPPADISFISFNGPPFNVPQSGFCEDGNVCTRDICATPNPLNGSGTCNHVPDSCSGDASDLCCPSGCIPIPSSAATCREAFDNGSLTQAQFAECDRDCKAIPCPIPTPTPTPPVLGLCLEGDGVAHGNNGNFDCKGATCSLDPAAAESPPAALGFVVFAGCLVMLAVRRRQRM